MQSDARSLYASKNQAGQWLPLLFLALGLLLFPLATARADLAAFTTIETVTDSDSNRVLQVTYIKDSRRRRELRGEGVLKDFLGDHVEITNGSTGGRIRLFPEAEEFVVDSIEEIDCGPLSLLDLNLLGRIRSKVSGTVVVPDTSEVIRGCESVPVEIVIPSRYGGGTYIRFWMCASFDALFGSAAVLDMDCGSTDSTRMDVNAGRAVASLKQQFRLSDADAKLLREHLVGYPVKVESVSSAAGKIHSTTTITTDSLSLESLPDSLFLPPLKYHRR